METKELEYTTERLDHLGIVAGICKQIKLIEIIDESLATPSERKVSCGEAVQAMVLNALGLTGRALYLMPEYMSNKPVDLLIREGLVADDFNDDTLGRALDEVQQAGVTELFARVASKAVEVFEVESEYVHLDTSSFSLHGAYESEVAERAVKVMEAVEIRHGYSKKQRPDLKQVVVTLITSQASALPLWLEVLDGNSNDKKSFAQTIKSYCRQLEEEETPPWFVMDSAAYSEENLTAWQTIGWVTRVPETVGEAKAVLQAVALEAMTDVGEGYRIYPLGNTYGGIRQRWLVVYSHQAYERESKQLDKRVARAEENAANAWRSLQKRTFQCQADAQAAAAQLAETLPWHRPQAQVVPLKKYAKPGRPAKDAVAQIVGWQLTGPLVLNEQAVAEKRQRLGRFIVATNVLDEAVLPNTKLLNLYKEQGSAVERGFRFLKDPLFFADSLFLKSPARIMAMIMIMGLALLVYALAERQLRRQLTAHNDTIPDQKGQPTQTPTMRRVAQIFEGVDILTIRQHHQVVARQVLNLTDLRRQIVSLLGPEVQYCYLVDF
ncbi:MAG: IS1634 family transposase [Caldilineaceae bacterium]|nr:IS1634 family transposase [Caldilineaceae bacterium]